jgi:hypothetical protein
MSDPLRHFPMVRWLSQSCDRLPGPTHLPGGCHPSGKDYERWAGIEDEPLEDEDDEELRRT